MRKKCGPEGFLGCFNLAALKPAGAVALGISKPVVPQGLGEGTPASLCG